MNKFKYIVLTVKEEWGDKELPFIFPSVVSHNHFAEEMKHLLMFHNNYNLPKVTSAGFINLENLHCSGYSETLKIGSRPELDRILIRSMNK